MFIRRHVMPCRDNRICTRSWHHQSYRARRAPQTTESESESAAVMAVGEGEG